MKKIILVALVFFALQTQAQVGTDLQFSQIVTLEGTAPSLSIQCNNSTKYTTSLNIFVPLGKVWKVITGGIGNSDGILQKKMDDEGNISNSNEYFEFFGTSINGTKISILSDSYLNEGRELFLIRICNLSCGQWLTNCNFSGKYTLQVIEYTVIP